MGVPSGPVVTTDVTGCGGPPGAELDELELRPLSCDIWSGGGTGPLLPLLLSTPAPTIID